MRRPIERGQVEHERKRRAAVADLRKSLRNEAVGQPVGAPGPLVILIATFVGVEPADISFVKEAAGFIKGHSGNIIANDFIRHGTVINTQFAISGTPRVLRHIRRSIPSFAGEFGMIGIMNEFASISDPVEVRSQGQYRLSIHARDYKGLLRDILATVDAAKFSLAQCHGRLRSLWPDEIPAAMREFPEAQAEYLVHLTLQPTPTSSREVLEAGFSKLYDKHGVIWSK